MAGDVQFTWVNRLGWFSSVSCDSGDLIEAPKPSPVPCVPVDVAPAGRVAFLESVHGYTDTGLRALPGRALAFRLHPLSLDA